MVTRTVGTQFLGSLKCCQSVPLRLSVQETGRLSELSDRENGHTIVAERNGVRQSDLSSNNLGAVVSKVLMHRKTMALFSFTSAWSNCVRLEGKIEQIRCSDASGHHLLVQAALGRI